LALRPKAICALDPASQLPAPASGTGELRGDRASSTDTAADEVLMRDIPCRRAQCAAQDRPGGSPITTEEIYAVPTEDKTHFFFVATLGSRPARVLVWDTRKVCVGRASDNDFCIDDVELSRHHAIFTHEGGVPVVKNLSETNGTFVNDEPVRSVGLTSGDRIRICDLELVFHQGRQNPLTLGRPVEFVSQLGEWSQEEDEDSGATMLGFDDSLLEFGRDFPTQSSAHEPARTLDASGEIEPVAAPRDLDLELEDLSIGDPAEEAGPLEPEPLPPKQPASFALRLRVRCRSDDLRTAILALVGRSLELPGIRIDVEADEED
jgi:pSer/pThr/pTyr-binding forkhead associated (FHA) protein